MTGPTRRFDPGELRVPGEPDLSVAEQADALLAARELEAVAASAHVRPTEGFEDRVMGAIATEPAPRLVVRPASAVRGGLIASFLLTVRDSWGVASSGGRPMAVRAQALAFVLLVAVAATAVTGLGAMGVGSLLDRGRSPAPSSEPGPSVAPTPSGPSPSVEPSPSVVPSGSPDTSGSPDPSETPEATETPEPTETNESEAESETARPTKTPEPTETPEPGKTPKPTETPDGTDDHSGSGSGSGSDDG
jgi:hypothetical protein